MTVGARHACMLEAGVQDEGLILLYANTFQNVFDSTISKCLHFFVGAILDGMGDEDASGIKSQGG